MEAVEKYANSVCVVSVLGTRLVDNSCGVRAGIQISTTTEHLHSISSLLKE